MELKLNKKMDACEITFAVGEVEEAISIIREAAKWLIDTGRPMWRIEDICKDKIKKSSEEFIVMKLNGSRIAAVILSFYDPFFWPDIKRGDSGFIIS